MAPPRAAKQAALVRTLVAGIAVVLTLLTTGCNLTDAPILSPKGPIALAERDILFRAFAIMMIVVDPGHCDDLLVRLALSRIQREGPLRPGVAIRQDRCGHLDRSGA